MTPCGYGLFQVKLDKVDVCFTFHPKFRFKIEEETRVKMTTQEAQEWTQKMGKHLSEFTCIAVGTATFYCDNGEHSEKRN